MSNIFKSKKDSKSPIQDDTVTEKVAEKVDLEQDPILEEVEDSAKNTDEGNFVLEDDTKDEVNFVLKDDPEDDLKADVKEDVDPEVLSIEEGERRLAIGEPIVESALTFDEQVIEKIVGLVLNDIEGVGLGTSSGGFFSLKHSSGVGIDVDENDQVYVDLNIVIEYGKSAPEIFEIIKKELRQKIAEITGLHLKHVNVHVANILSPEEFGQ